MSINTILLLLLVVANYTNLFLNIKNRRGQDAYLLALLAAIALPTAVNAGDLEATDFETPEANIYEITEKTERALSEILIYLA